MKLITNNHIIRYAFTSISLHLLILIVSSIYLFNSSQAPSAFIGNDNANIINAFTYTGSSPYINNKLTMTKKEKPVIKKADFYEKSAVPTRQMTASNIATNSGSKSHGDHTNELLALLHAAIQEKQEYPDSALQLEREGRVTVEFLLDQNGEVSNIRIAKSSGTTSLDEAAVHAVQNASPFVMAKKFLKNTKEYSVDVIFKLA